MASAGALFHFPGTGKFSIRGATKVGTQCHQRQTPSSSPLHHPCCWLHPQLLAQPLWQFQDISRLDNIPRKKRHGRFQWLSLRSEETFPRNSPSKCPLSLIGQDQSISPFLNHLLERRMELIRWAQTNIWGGKEVRKSTIMLP